MYKLCFFVPDTHVEEVKKAIFKTGAGSMGNYDSCCWQTAGEGQFRALPDSQPFIGEHNCLSLIKEYKVEMVCGSDSIHAAIKALKQAHPYETPAYDVYQLVQFPALNSPS